MPITTWDLRCLPERSRGLLTAALALLIASLAAAAPVRAQGSWAILGHPTTRDLNKLAFIDSQRGWVVGDSGTILVTSNGGTSWTAQASPVPFDIVDVDIVGDRFGWALAKQFPSDTSFVYGSTVLRTTNAGSAWFVQATFDEVFLHAIEFTDSLRGCLGGDLGALWYTSDGGVNWTAAVVDSPQTAHWPILDFEFYTPTYGVATGGFYDVNGLVWRTTDGGAFWTHKRAAGEPLFGSHFFDSLNVISVGGDLDYGAGMVRTTNAGQKWQYTYLGIWGQASAISFRTASEAWAPLGFAGTYMTSQDSGRTWTATFTPDSTGMVDVAFTDSNTGYMVGFEGTVLKYGNPATGVANSLAAHPIQGLLLQASPNPFHMKTQVAFNVPRFDAVSLAVYDLLGRRVATLVDEHLPAGTYARSFDASGLASGVYFYRLETGRFTETRKVILIR